MVIESAMSHQLPDSMIARATPVSGPAPLLTIVIPAYNEESRLPASLLKIDDFLRQQPYTAEVLSLIHISEPTETVLDLVCRLLLEKKK